MPLIAGLPDSGTSSALMDTTAWPGMDHSDGRNAGIRKSSLRQKRTWLIWERVTSLRNDPGIEVFE